MCQIIVKNHKDIKEVINFLIDEKENLKALLNTKGGEGYSFSLVTDNNMIVHKFEKEFDLNYKFFLKTVTDYILYEKFKDTKENIINEGLLVFFSRQQPEMEEEFHLDLLPPFKTEKENDIMYTWTHGTINNDKELIEKYQLKDIKVDTEIVEKVPREELKGLYSILRVNKSKLQSCSIYDYQLIDGGLGWWTNKENDLAIVQPFDNTYGLSKIKTVSQLKLTEKNYLIYNPVELYVAYSGGMDITLSTIKALNDYKIRYEGNTIKLNLYYFRYGSRAEKEEIKALYKFEKFLKEFGNKININLDINVVELDVTKVLSGMIDLYGNCKLTDEKAEGDIKETESNLQYVPFRNSLFVQILSNEIDKEIDKDYSKKDIFYKIIFGLNLSEGQVFGDNSIRWKEHIEQVASIGGKYYKNVEMVTPYIHKTKINMLKDFKEYFNDKFLMESLDIAFSCYYPKEDGSACGECGSCILRQKAIEKIM